MNDKIIYWIWLQMALGIGNPKATKLLELYDYNVEYIYKEDERGLRLTGILTNKNIEALKDENFLVSAKKAFDKCNTLGYDILTIDNENYPQKLKSIYNPPVVLYIQGNLNNIDDVLSISIVGTRSATQSGLDISFKIAYDLARNGCTVVSGGALGIDSASHKGALQAEGKTITVLGCGINYMYLPKLLSMRNTIAKTGAVVSEYPPDYPPLPRNFPARNRIISGLSNGVLVVEAGAKSGSLITANFAAEQNRDVFAIPGNIKTSTAEGTNALIKDGAKLVVNVKDILDEYNQVAHFENEKDVGELEHKDELFKKEKSLKSSKEELEKNEKPLKLPQSLSQNAKRVYEVLEKSPKHIDDISFECNIKANEALQAVTELELLGFIKPLSGRRYVKN